MDHGLDKGIAYIIRYNLATSKYEAINGDDGTIAYTNALPTVVFKAVATVASNCRIILMGISVALTETIYWKAGVYIYGTGKEVTKISGANNLDIFNFNNGGTLVYRHGGIYDLSLWSGDNGTGCVVDALWGFEIHNCLFWRNSGILTATGIKFINEAYEGYITNCAFGMLKTCIYTESNAIHIFGNDLSCMDGGVCVDITEGADACKIIGNYIEQPTGAGGICVRILDTETRISSRNEVIGNLIHAGYTATGYGIYLAAGENKLSDNSFWVTGGGVGVYLHSGWENIISVNHFHVDNGRGIYAPDSGTAGHNIINDNEFYHNGYRAIDVHRNNLTINGNHIFTTNNAISAAVRLADKIDFIGNTLYAEPGNTQTALNLFGNDCIILGNSFENYTVACDVQASIPNTIIAHNRFTSITTPIYKSSAIHQVVIHCNIGYNPVGNVANPLRNDLAGDFIVDSYGNSNVWVSDTVYTNTQSEKTLYISGGTVTAIRVNGVITGLIDGSFPLMQGDTIQITYSVAPTVKTMVR
jgi:hypothetical protein